MKQSTIVFTLLRHKSELFGNNLVTEENEASAKLAGRVVAGRSLVGAPLSNVQILLKHALKLVTVKAAK